MAPLRDTPMRVLITGAAGQIGYALAPMVARGAMLGAEQGVILHLLDIPFAAESLEGVRMELIDAAFPLVKGVRMHRVSLHSGRVPSACCASHAAPTPPHELAQRGLCPLFLLLNTTRRPASWQRARVEVAHAGEKGLGWVRQATNNACAAPPLAVSPVTPRQQLTAGV